MKSKKLSGNLVLNKKTVSDLSGTVMKDVKGGTVFTQNQYTCFYISCFCPSQFTCRMC